MKPLLFLDIDGVLNILPPGREHFPGRAKAKIDVEGHYEDSVPVKVVYDPGIKAKLQQVFQAYEVVVASAFWHKQARHKVLPLFGLAVHSADVLDLRGLGNHDKPPRGDGGKMPWEKIAAIEQYVFQQGNPPFAVVDDKCDKRIEAWDPPQPHLYVAPDPHRGLVEKDLDKLLKFAAGIEDAQSGNTELSPQAP